MPNFDDKKTANERKTTNASILERLKTIGVPVYSKRTMKINTDQKGGPSAIEPVDEKVASNDAVMTPNKIEEEKLSDEQKAMHNLFQNIGQLSNPKDKNDPLAKILQEIAVFQRAYDEAIREKKPLLKHQLLKQKKVCENLLKDLNLTDPMQIQLRSQLMEDLEKISNHAVLGPENQATLVTAFDDERLYTAKKSVKKEGGANPGYTVTNDKDTRFTVKQGSSVGNTLSEAFSSMVLSRVVEASGLEDRSQVVIANAFLTVKLDETAQGDTMEERCKKSLFAASQWSSDRASFEACQLFGLEKRVKRAGSRKADDFKVLRKINEVCKLGLEAIVLPTVLIADFDLHTENYMLKVNIDKVPPENMAIVNHHLELLKQEMLKTDKVNSEDRVTYLIGIIKVLQDAGANVYFHKIDHDSGFYRYSDPDRKVDFSSHRTSPLHFEGLRLKTQPTLHIVEITGGTKGGFDQLLLSDESINKLLNLDLDKELKIVSETANNFFAMVHEKAEVIAGKDNKNDRLEAEFFLLNEFYHHITEKRMPTPKVINDTDIEKMKATVLEQLAEGTKLKVTDLQSQVYKRLLEMQNKNYVFKSKQMDLFNFLEKQPNLRDVVQVRETNVHRPSP